MPPNSKVLWKEGMFLQPQHFQMLERLQTAHTNTRAASLAYCGHQYGFTELEIDRDALLGGNFSILRAAGVLPDGECFSIGINSPLDGLAKPLSRSFTSYCRADQLTLDVYLAIPISVTKTSYDDDRQNTGELLYEESRYIERTIFLPDDYSYDNNKEIDVWEPNYLIRFEGEPLDDCVCLRVARLSKTGGGYMELCRDYAPPALFTRVSDVLKGCVGGLLELLWARMGSLAQYRKQNELGQAFFSASQESSYRLFNTLCTFTPFLSRLHELPKIHPFDYYTRLTMLYGSLLSFSPSIALENFPPYDHNDPATAFIALTGNIRESLKVEFWTNCTALPLEQINPTTWFCRFPDERFLAGVNLFIGVSAKGASKELLIDVLQRMRVSSRDKLDLLISSSMQGLSLIHVRNIPEGLAVKPDYIYFAIDKQGQFWQGVETSGTLGIHFSGGGYQEMKIEILALRHQG
ncbi:MAG: type VI secretion system baseplate subunit TssK [Chitinispirillales bacterium]|jgi:type VI secretion system protein ImpJ|nr:type VI secretion system baseplate subunit TssK [Chitinispirillales bacterium]